MSSTELEEPGQLKRAVIDASAGAVAGAISRMVTSPLDVIKIRFQVRKILDSLAFCGFRLCTYMFMTQETRALV